MTILNRWFEEVWNQGREATIDELLASDVIGHGLADPDGKEVNGIESFRAFWKTFRAAFSGIHIEVQDTITQGPLTVARFVATGRHTGEGLGKPPKGNPIQFTGMTMARIHEGKIAESWNNIDFLTMYQQMD